MQLNPQRVIMLPVIAFAIYVSGCTSYSGCRDAEDKVIARYDQNIIRDDDSQGYAFWKGVKHGFFDIVTLATCEIWYSHVRRSYYETYYYAYLAADKERSQGAKALASFLGLKLGEPIPKEMADKFHIAPLKNPNVFSFTPEHPFSTYPYSFRVSVTPNEKKVWEICAFLSLYPDKEDMNRAKEIDESGPVTSFTSGYVSANGFYSGSTTTYKASGQQYALLTGRAKMAAKEQKRLHGLLEKKYGKKFHKGIMAFEGERYLIVPECNRQNDLWVKIRAVDFALEHEISDQDKYKDAAMERSSLEAF